VQGVEETTTWGRLRASAGTHVTGHVSLPFPQTLPDWVNPPRNLPSESNHPSNPRPAYSIQRTSSAPRVGYGLSLVDDGHEPIARRSCDHHDASSPPRSSSPCSSRLRGPAHRDDGCLPPPLFLRLGWSLPLRPSVHRFSYPTGSLTDPIASISSSSAVPMASTLPLPQHP
jgi:hypothetical protein